MQRAYGSGALHRDERSAEFPRVAWIRQALDMFVSLALAYRGESNGDYVVNYRPFDRRVDLLERFVKLVDTKQGLRGRAYEEQLPLPLQREGKAQSDDTGESRAAKMEPGTTRPRRTPKGKDA